MNDDTPHRGIQVSGAEFILLYERLARIETTLDGIRQDRADIQKDHDDHEGRLRSVEKWKYVLPPTLVTALVSAAVAVYGQLGK